MSIANCSRRDSRVIHITLGKLSSALLYIIAKLKSWDALLEASRAVRLAGHPNRG